MHPVVLHGCRAMEHGATRLVVVLGSTVRDQPVIPMHRKEWWGLGCDNRSTLFNVGVYNLFLNIFKARLYCNHRQ